MKIAICGARGFLGGSVMRSALMRNVEVVAFARSSEGLGGDVVSFGLDFGCRDSWYRLPSLVFDCVVYCAGRAHVSREDSRTRYEFLRSNVEGVQNALDFARRSGARRFILASSISVYNFGLAGAKSELSPCAPSGQYGESKLAGEKVCLDTKDIEVVVVRLATLFGIGDVANIYRMGRAIRAGRFFIPGVPDSRKSVLPVDLAAEIILRLAERGGGGHSVFNVALSEAPSLAELCDVFSNTCGFGKVPILSPAVSMGVGWVGDMATPVWHSCPFNSTVRRKISQSTVVKTDRLYSTLDDVRPKPFADWMRDYAEYYRLS